MSNTPIAEVQPKAAPTQHLHPSNEAVVRQIRSGGGWLYWIAGLSVVNLALLYFEAPIRFAVGLTFTEFLLGVGMALAPVGPIVALCVNVVALAAVGAIGHFAQQGKMWALVLGLVVVGGDLVITALLLQGEGIISLIIHGAAVYYLVIATKASSLLEKRKANGQA